MVGLPCASVSPRSDRKEKFLVTEGKRQAAECEEVRVEDDFAAAGKVQERWHRGEARMAAYWGPFGKKWVT